MIKYAKVEMVDIMEVFCIIFLPLLKSPDEKDYDFDDNPSFNDEGQRDIETKIRSMFR